MAAAWLSNLAFLFQPEDSSRFADEKHFLPPAFQSLSEKALISIKVLIWIIISIIAGLMIGHLS